MLTPSQVFYTFNNQYTSEMCSPYKDDVALLNKEVLLT